MAVKSYLIDELSTEDELKEMRPDHRKVVVEAEGEFRKAIDELEAAELALEEARGAFRVAERELAKIYERGW